MVIKTTMRQCSLTYQAAKWAYQPLKAMIFWIKRLKARAHARGFVRAYLTRDGFKALQVGCGPYIKWDWLNSDLLDNARRKLYVDITEPLPLPDNSLDAIYAAEVIEHIPENNAIFFFEQASRVLKPGGVLRMTTPDLAEICRLFIGQCEKGRIEQFAEIWLGPRFTPERWVNSQFLDHGHRCIYTFGSLRDALNQAGFDEIVQCEPQETKSQYPQLQNLEDRYGKTPPTWYFARTLIVEATKKP